MAFQNITLRKARENSLQFQAERDPLTLAWNRRYFEKLAQERIKETLRKQQNFSLLMIDADKFKNVNDTYGHKTGDKVLTELVACCQNDLREDDIVCRFGGEEFIIYLDNTDSFGADCCRTPKTNSCQFGNRKRKRREISFYGKYRRGFFRKNRKFRCFAAAG